MPVDTQVPRIHAEFGYTMYFQPVLVFIYVWLAKALQAAVIRLKKAAAKRFKCLSRHMKYESSKQPVHCYTRPFIIGVPCSSFKCLSCGSIREQDHVICYEAQNSIIHCGFCMTLTVSFSLLEKPNDSEGWFQMSIGIRDFACVSVPAAIDLTSVLARWWLCCQSHRKPRNCQRQGAPMPLQRRGLYDPQGLQTKGIF